jgi:thiamine biosynthesis lipoprotein
MSSEPRKVSRRQALRITAATGMTLAFGGAVGRAFLENAGLRRRSEKRIQMGTEVTVTVFHPDPSAAREMVEVTFAEIERLESILSRHRSGTPVARLARDGVVRDSPVELTEVLARATEYSVLTDGAFDVTIAPLLDLYRARAAAGAAPPSGREVADALALVDYRALRLDGRTIALDRPGMAVTLDGIAKGYVVDRAVARLVAAGADRVLVGASGDLATSPEVDGDGWEVAIQDPRNAAGSLGILRLHGQGVATSGDYMQAFTPDRSLHHILDPRTGRSPDHTSAVTTIARTAMDADALSTAAFVLGPDEGVALLEKLDGVEGLVVTKDGRQLQTRGFRRAL